MEAELQEPPPGLDVENAKYRLGLYCKETVVVEEKAVACVALASLNID